MFNIQSESFPLPLNPERPSPIMQGSDASVLGTSGHVGQLPDGRRPGSRRSSDINLLSDLRHAPSFLGPGPLSVMD